MSTQPTEGNGNVLRYQVREHDKALKDLDHWQREVDVERVEFRSTVKSLSEDMGTLAASVNDLRKTLLGLAITIAGAAIVALFTVLVATGKV